MIRFTSSSGSVDLPNPILGDPEQLNTFVKYEFSMSKVIRSSIKTASHSKFLLTFDNLTTDEKDAFISFLVAASGKSVTYRDYNSVDHVGLIIGDPFEFTQVAARGLSTGSVDCKEIWTATIEFEAVNP